MSVRDVVQAAAGALGGDKLYVEDVFSTYLHTGNGSTQTITNGIDLDGESGLVWIKKWTDTGNHVLSDTERDWYNYLPLPIQSGQTYDTSNITSFNSDGFSLGSGSLVNASAQGYVSWTFRKTPKFFDVVTYTGTGSAQTIAHSLGGTVGALIIKRTSGSGNYSTFVRTSGAAGSTLYAYFNSTSGLNLTAAAGASGVPAESIGYITTTGFKPNDLSGSGAAGNVDNINENGATYVAYLFAHDAGGFGEDGEQNIISCGSYVGNGSTSTYNEISVGFEPQWVLTKNITSIANWQIGDIMRGQNWEAAGGSANPLINRLSSNLNSATDRENGIIPATNGFAVNGSSGANISGNTYIYIAIRRGPMKPVESSSEVYNTTLYTTASNYNITTNWPVDFSITTLRNSGQWRWVFDRIRGSNTSNRVYAASDIVAGTGVWKFDNNTKVVDNYWVSQQGLSGYSAIAYNWRRAPGFFDMVAYKGNSVSGRTIPHNLGVVPEMIWVKIRGAARNWAVYHSALGATKKLTLDTGDLPVTSSIYWNNTEPTNSVFTVGNYDDVNDAGSGGYYIAYLFASLAGVSKVWSATISGSDVTVDCGFSNGAALVLCKRTDSVGYNDWFVWTSAQGITAGNDPYLWLNGNSTENTSTDYIDPNSSGFTLVSGGLPNGTYVGYAIALP